MDASACLLTPRRSHLVIYVSEASRELRRPDDGPFWNHKTQAKKVKKYTKIIRNQLTRRIQTGTTTITTSPARKGEEEAKTKHLLSYILHKLFSRKKWNQTPFAAASRGGQDEETDFTYMAAIGLLQAADESGGCGQDGANVPCSVILRSGKMLTNWWILSAFWETAKGPCRWFNEKL